ncbi:uncharacterized protein [Centruroides vittatus]|uniref:uncharacterized protein n=1 Tax=Centruroides vittatus TaxID=120091 RepID=UPI0035103AFC
METGYDETKKSEDELKEDIEEGALNNQNNAKKISDGSNKTVNAIKEGNTNDIRNYTNSTADESVKINKDTFSDAAENTDDYKPTVQDDSKTSSGTSTVNNVGKSTNSTKNGVGETTDTAKKGAEEITDFTNSKKGVGDPLKTGGVITDSGTNTAGEAINSVGEITNSDTSAFGDSIKTGGKR